MKIQLPWIWKQVAA